MGNESLAIAANPSPPIPRYMAMAAVLRNSCVGCLMPVAPNPWHSTLRTCLQYYNILHWAGRKTLLVIRLVYYTFDAMWNGKGRLPILSGIVKYVSRPATPNPVRCYLILAHLPTRHAQEAYCHNDVCRLYALLLRAMLQKGDEKAGM